MMRMIKDILDTLSGVHDEIVDLEGDADDYERQILGSSRDLVVDAIANLEGIADDNGGNPAETPATSRPDSDWEKCLRWWHSDTTSMAYYLGELWAYIEHLEARIRELEAVE